MSGTIEELAAKRKRWVEANRENGFEAGLKRLLTELYPDSAHFIYELLQNAEDAHAQEVRFILYEDHIEFEHNGERLFSIKDVDAITSIGFSTKRDDVTNIGKFGVGFKAVLAYTETPEIESGEFHFRIRDMVVPEPNGLARSYSEDKKTRFILPFDNSKKSPQQARSEIEELLRYLGATTLLFLTHIRKIEYLLPDSTIGYIERVERRENRFEIRVQHPNELAPSSTWFLLFDKLVQVEDEEAENESNKVKSCRIAVAFGLVPVDAKATAKEKKDCNAEAPAEWELAPMEPGRVCIYFPADKETANLRFHLHAPFASTVARDSVRDCSGNNLLRDHLADLLAESMSTIRNQGLLNVRALALLPNDKDNLPTFYQPLMKRIVEEFKEKNLVPMKRGGHAAADGVFRGSKALSDLIDDDDMVTLLGDDYVTPIWASNPPQRNQREDNFLSMLGITQWDVAELVKALGSLNEDVLGQWLVGKDEECHQVLYEMLMDYMNAAPKYPNTGAAERRDAIKRISLVRCSDGTYRKGIDCYFPTEGAGLDGKFPRVAKGVYCADKEDRKKAREFLQTVGVREVDEKAEIEYILKERYSQEAVDKKQFRPELNDMARFIGFVEKHPDAIELFQSHYIFKLESGKWGTPKSVFVDTPFMDTGLREWFEAQDDTKRKTALSSEYETCGIKPEKIGEYAKKLGAYSKLCIEKTSATNHPEWHDLSQRGGERCSGYGKDENYHIPGLTKFLANSSVSKSKLVWRTMKEQCCGDYPTYLQAQFGRNASYTATAKSTLVHELRKTKWVPQKNGEIYEFVQPRDAVAEKLPEGFVYQTGWQWLQALEFGKGVEEQGEAQKRETERQTQEYKRKEQVLKEIGFDSPEEAEEMAKLKKENPEEFRKFRESIAARKERPMFPTRPVANPERRQERLGEQLNDAPDKEHEKRERSVRTSNGAIDPITWLRNQYMNEANQMVCQICKQEMPFRKRDGDHYFEKKEVLSRKFLPKEHEAQYLALCPLCAAKYEEFVKSDDNVMAELKQAIVSSEECKIPIILGQEETSIQFVETHFMDLKTIVEASET
jgi:hypothetical protein